MRVCELYDLFCFLPVARVDEVGVGVAFECLIEGSRQFLGEHLAREAQGTVHLDVERAGVPPRRYHLSNR